MEGIVIIGLIIAVAAFLASTSTERRVMHDVDRIARDNEKMMWKEINKSNEEWRNSHK